MNFQSNPTVKLFINPDNAKSKFDNFFKITNGAKLQQAAPQ